MATPIVDTIDVLELDSCRSEVRLDDEAGDPVPLASLSALTLTLYGHTEDEIINSRDEASVLNVNGGTFHATSGEFVMDFVSADNPIVGTSLSTGAKETHYALFVATWGVGKRKSWIVRLRVAQLHRVP